MVNVIDFIETSDAPAARAVWLAVCDFLSMQPGYIAGELLETIRSVQPRTDVKFTSICQWESAEAWQAARTLARQDAGLSRIRASTPAKFTAFNGVLHAGCGYDVQSGSAGSMVLVDVVYMNEERMEGYAQMWARAKAFMCKQDAYLGASLYRTIDLSNDIKYVNIARWGTMEHFFKALDTPEFYEILGDYAQDFALYLSNSSTCVLGGTNFTNRPSEIAK